MKAFALGGRAKWKDYVDLWFILESGIQLSDIIQKAKMLFNTDTSTVFVDKIFLEQLTYYGDVSYEEEVIYLIDSPPSEKQIKIALKNFVFNYIDTLNK